MIHTLSGYKTTIKPKNGKFIIKEILSKLPFKYADTFNHRASLTRSLEIRMAF